MERLRISPLPSSPQYQLPVRAGNAQVSQEQATLIVNGINYMDWDSVWVQLRWTGSSPLFKFTSVERDAAPADLQIVPGQRYTSMQFMPGDAVEVNLGGITVIRGFIETRQVAYDVTHHGVELQGKGYQELVARSSVNTETGSFDGMTWKQVADKVVSPYGISVVPIGNLNSIPFDKLQNQPGEMIWDFLERIARPRGIILGSDSFGNFLAIDEHHMPVLNTQLIEGQNIKKMQCVIHKEWVYAQYCVTAQCAASNDNAFTAASELRAIWGGTGLRNSFLLTPSEQPVKNIQEVIDRAKNEALWHEGPQIECTVTVQGWFRDDVNVWWPGDNVFVYSPMCPLSLLMKIEQVTFTQDNNQGTETTLILKQPWALKDTAPPNVAPTGSTISSPAPTEVKPGEEIKPTG
jgi:prophage tail gpP-like protein